jgi:hypothetical protein
MIVLKQHSCNNYMDFFIKNHELEWWNRRIPSEGHSNPKLIRSLVSECMFDSPVASDVYGITNVNTFE